MSMSMCPSRRQFSTLADLTEIERLKSDACRQVVEKFKGIGMTRVLGEYAAMMKRRTMVEV